MQKPAKINYKVYQGSTFNELFRWESETKVYEPIQSISKSAPCVITTQNPTQIPAGWRVRVVGAGGMREINQTDPDAFYIATGATGSTVTLNQVNSLLYNTYTSGGVIEYNEPVNLFGYSARMQIRETVDSTEVIHESTTANGEIRLNNTYKTVEILIPASATTQFSFTTAVYSLELFTASGVVVPFLAGNLTLVPEVTRDD